MTLHFTVTGDTQRPEETNQVSAMITYLCESHSCLQVLEAECLGDQ
jgi:hypothetical protein